ncbi:hypothetical protein FB451DRAFT_1514938 [Mycena latifolia]|nr:hypothetical protein FB451DRAFT_1514938 [Mycena latifolia]
MQLPPEMRVEIYSHLFFSTRLAWGERALGRISHQRIGHAPNGLALLRTCRQVHAESPEAMLDKLANIPIATRALIRYARVSGDPLMLSWEDDDAYYRTSQALKLLPGLALDRLTVLGPRGREVCYETLDMLVRHGAGWRELYYLSHDSTFLAYKHEWFAAVGDPDEHRYLRVPQPAGWQRTLDARDGPASGASVAIYRATAPRRPGSRPPSRHPRRVADAALMAPGEREKEVLVVVKRGRGVDYAEKEGSPYLDDGDIREAMPGKTWKQIKAQQAELFRDFDDDPFSDEDSEEEEEPCEVDMYIHVDEYVWPPLHFSTE